MSPRKTSAVKTPRRPKPPKAVPQRSNVQPRTLAALPKAIPQRSNIQRRGLAAPPKPSTQVVTPPVEDDLEVLPPERTLLDIVDNLLSQGVVISGDAVLGVADVDLVYLKLSVLLCAVDRLVR